MNYVQLTFGLLVLFFIGCLLYLTIDSGIDIHKANVWCKENGFDGVAIGSSNICVNYNCETNKAGTTTCNHYYKRIPV